MLILRLYKLTEDPGLRMNNPVSCFSTGTTQLLVTSGLAKSILAHYVALYILLDNSDMGRIGCGFNSK
jgi:hypothetical protein